MLHWVVSTHWAFRFVCESCSLRCPASQKRARDVNQMFRGLYGLFEIENSAQGLFIAKLPAERAYQPATPQGA
eukprot:6184836-Pleurochrysis_carterae.AAC.6